MFAQAVTDLTPTDLDQVFEILKTPSYLIIAVLSVIAYFMETNSEINSKLIPWVLIVLSGAITPVLCSAGDHPGQSLLQVGLTGVLLGVVYAFIAWVAHEKIIKWYINRSKNGSGSSGRTNLKVLVAVALVPVLMFGTTSCLSTKNKPEAQPGSTTEVVATKVPAYADIVDGMKKLSRQAIDAYKTPTGQTVVHAGLISLGKFLIQTIVPPDEQQDIKDLMSGWGGALAKIQVGTVLTSDDVVPIFNDFYPTTGEQRAMNYNQTIGTLSVLLESVIPAINAMGTPGWINATLYMFADAAWQIGGMSGQVSTWKPYAGN